MPGWKPRSSPTSPSLCTEPRHIFNRSHADPARTQPRAGARTLALSRQPPTAVGPVSGRGDRAPVPVRPRAPGNSGLARRPRCRATAARMPRQLPDWRRWPDPGARSSARGTHCATSNSASGGPGRQRRRWLSPTSFRAGSTAHPGCSGSPTCSETGAGAGSASTGATRARQGTRSSRVAPTAALVAPRTGTAGTVRAAGRHCGCPAFSHLSANRQQCTSAGASA